MGLFQSLFGGSNAPKDTKQLPWQPLIAVSELETIAKTSVTKTQFIFKHSTRCGISSMVMNQFVAAYNLELNADLYYLDLLSYRNVSDEVGYKFQVMHQSPQLLVIRNGVAVAHASHSAINSLNLEQYV